MEIQKLFNCPRLLLNGHLVWVPNNLFTPVCCMAILRAVYVRGLPQWAVQLALPVVGVSRWRFQMKVVPNPLEYWATHPTFHKALDSCKEANKTNLSGFWRAQALLPKKQPHKEVEVREQGTI